MLEIAYPPLRARQLFSLGIYWPRQGVRRCIRWCLENSVVCALPNTIHLWRRLHGRARLTSSRVHAARGRYRRRHSRGYRRCGRWWRGAGRGRASELRDGDLACA